VKVIIPAAGIGSRLRPHTHSAPKALLYVAGKPILGHIIDSVLKLSPSEITIITGFLGDKVVDYVTGSYAAKVRFVDQEELLGLGYAVYLGMRPGDTEDLLVILGDTIIDTDWNGLFGRKQNILAVKEVEDPTRFGVVETIGTRIVRIEEKPERPKSMLASVGVYYFKDTARFYEALDHVYRSGLRTRGEFQVTDAFSRLIELGVELHAFTIDGWFDCGKRETMLETNRYLLARLPENVRKAEIPGSVTVPPVYIDPDATVEKSIIGPNTSVAAGSVIINSIVSDSIISAGARVENARLTSSLIGNNAIVTGVFKLLNVGDSSEISY
jgi:glucose-1-phosphate thymidylyltransferase